MLRYTGQQTLALAKLRRIAMALGAVGERVVFIGGAIAPLLQTDQRLLRVRPTKDVDAIAASTSYTDFDQFQRELRTRGFREAAMAAGATGGHAHRWIAPNDGGFFDIVPGGAHFGGTGSMTDVYALSSRISVDLAEPGLAEPGHGAPCVVRHASAVAFLALKWAAFNDRGKADPFASHDLEDIVAVILSRPMLAAEYDAAPESIRHLIATATNALLSDPNAEELLHAQLNGLGTQAGNALGSVRAQLQRMAAPN